MGVFLLNTSFFTLKTICCIILDEYKSVENKKGRKKKKWLKVKKYNLL